jgi:hypothetical protein
VPFAAHDSLPAFGVLGIIGHHVVLAVVLPEPANDPMSHGAAVHDHTDLLIRDTSHVVGH